MLLFLGVVGVWKGIDYANNFIRQAGLSPMTVLKIIFNDGIDLKSQKSRTNIMVLGIAGGDHDGHDLTDTIMILSINTDTKAMSMISIPRDVWSDALKDKVNSAYHYGEEKKLGGGRVLAKAIVEDIVGIPIHYDVVLDFSGFKNVIDLVGGIDVNVSREFIDPNFPIEGKENDMCDGDITYKCRYETISFVQGIQHMDGITALKYVRSRHAQGDEGSDFARSSRQQEVLLALKEKVFAPSFWVYPQQSIKLLNAVDMAIETDMNIGELLTIGKKIKNTSLENITKISIEDYLITPSQGLFGGKYVLVPKDSFDAIHQYIKSKLE